MTKTYQGQDNAALQRAFKIGHVDRSCFCSVQSRAGTITRSTKTPQGLGSWITIRRGVSVPQNPDIASVRKPWAQCFGRASRAAAVRPSEKDLPLLDYGLGWGFRVGFSRVFFATRLAMLHGATEEGMV